MRPLVSSRAQLARLRHKRIRPTRRRAQRGVKLACPTSPTVVRDCGRGRKPELSRPRPRATSTERWELVRRGRRRTVRTMLTAKSHASSYGTRSTRWFCARLREALEMAFWHNVAQTERTLLHPGTARASVVFCMTVSRPSDRTDCYRSCMCQGSRAFYARSARTSL